MIESLLLALTFVLSPAPDCAAQAGWNTGREGKVAAEACRDEDYREAYRLGEALHQLKQEHAGIESRIATEADAGALRRRQRQITIDLEAIRGVATTRGWPLDIAPEITP